MDTLKAMFNNGAALVDVRSPAEVAQMGHPKALNIPLQTLPYDMGQLDKAKPVIVFCASGMRSSQAAAFLSQQGYEVHNAGSVFNVLNY